MATVGTAFDSRRNNFDAIRLGAAVVVLVSHSYALTGRPEYEVFHLWLGNSEFGGTLAVAVFFVISGFLVTRSAVEHDTLKYLRARVLRIVPAIAILCVFEVGLVGLAFTTLPRSDYLSNPDTLRHFLNIFVFGIRGSLPGVFSANPNPLVNGSLWTLPVECLCYLALPLLLALGLVRRWNILILLFATIVAFVWASLAGLDWVNDGGSLAYGVPLYPALKYFIYFAIGSVFWLHREDIPLNGGMALLCVALWYAGVVGIAKPVITYLTLPYLTIYLASSRPIFAQLKERLGDLSYGVYLFAFPVQQSIVALRPGIGPLHATAYAVPIVLLLAFLCWHYIERPALKWRTSTSARISSPT